MERRDFLRGCAALAATHAADLWASAKTLAPHFYARVLLVDPQGAPLRAGAVPPHTNLVFHYPYAGTPCFLLNLGRPLDGPVRLRTAQGELYEWRGGVGPGRSIVAYSAICAHKLAYPTRQISFISYRSERRGANRHANVIHCCAEHSQYDPAQGGRVLAGPATQPLAAILLEHDRGRDELYAVGTLGGELFGEFFARYEFRLALEGTADARRALTGSTVVTELASYCRQRVQC